MSKAKQIDQAKAGDAVVVHYLESPNAIVSEAKGTIAKLHGDGYADVVATRSGGRGEMRLFRVAPLNPNALYPLYPAWEHTS